MLFSFEMKEINLYKDSILQIDINIDKSEHNFFFMLYVPCKQSLSKSFTPGHHAIRKDVFKKLAGIELRGGIEQIIINYDSEILNSIKREGISVDGLQVAILIAHRKYEKDKKFYNSKMYSG